MTAHNEAKINDFAKTVLMPGDPKRAKYIAENYFESPRLVNDVRGVQGYSGKYKGKDISVMASGMGMPSMGIYAHELFSVYNVENIIRIGTAGGISEKVKLYDVIFAQAACYDSHFAAHYSLPGTYSAAADFTLLSQGVLTAGELSTPFTVGTVLTSDCFYTEQSREPWRKMGVLAVEMETAALYMTAARLNKKALSILTVSDHLLTKEETTPSERETAFNDMITVALNTAIRMAIK